MLGVYIFTGGIVCACTCPWYAYMDMDVLGEYCSITNELQTSQRKR